MEVAIIKEIDVKEVSVSPSLMKKWEVIHETFLFETVTQYVERVTNEGFKYYPYHSSLYNNNTRSPEQSNPLALYVKEKMME